MGRQEGLPRQERRVIGEVDKLRETVVTAARVLENEGLYDYIGHVSARIPGTDRVLITPHLREMSFRDVTARDVVTLDLKGNHMDGRLKSPSEFWLHICTYRVRPDVFGMIHVHPEACVAMGIAEVPLVPLYVTSGVFAKGVPLFKVPSLITTEALGEEMAKALGDRNAILLKWHGVVTVGPTVEEACMTAIALEKLARIQVMAMSVTGGKTVEALPPEAPLTDPVILSPWAGWEYFVSRLPR